MILKAMLQYVDTPTLNIEGPKIYVEQSLLKGYFYSAMFGKNEEKVKYLLRNGGRI
jgi:hypothetical protein